jgi:ATP-dependent helicase/nuclease subunit B
VPNKLVGFYIQKALRSQTSETTWSPVICTLPELATTLSKKNLCSTTTSLHHLAAAYRDTLPFQASEMSQFIKWGQKLHTDFMDVAMSLADANQIYRDLRSIKEVEHWEIGADVLTGSQQKFMLFWNALEDIYSRWKELQESTESMVYPVMLRWLLSNARQWEDGWHGKSVAVIGLGGFSRAEDMLLKMIKSKARVEVVWDADRFYVEHNWHEAGYAIRQSSSWINPAQLIDALMNRPLQITHIEAESFHGQCAAIIERLKSSTPEELQRTALILPDETWLHPMIGLLEGQSLLGNECRVSMKLGHALMAWIPKVLKLNSSKLGRRLTYYNRDLMELLDLSSGWLLDATKVMELQSALMGVSRGYWNNDFLEQIGWFVNVPACWRKLFLGLDCIEIIGLLVQTASEFNTGQNKLVDDIIAALSRIEDSILSHEEMREGTVLSWLWQLEVPSLLAQSIQNHDGQLQVLLMTDTRALDFERIILPGMNEGSIPKKAEVDSFIPLDVRRLHNMHLPQDVEASYAYVFYRLLQRANHVTLVSGAVDTQLREQEVSRFLHQIQSELMPYNDGIIWEKQAFRLPLQVPPTLPVPLSNAWSRQRIEQMIERGLSASAINKYRECPLDFYFRYIAKLDEPTEIDETITDAELGVLVHAVLEEFYGEFLGRYPEESDFARVIESLDDCLQRALIKEKMHIDISSGYNTLIHLAAKQMLLRYLKFEQKQLATLPKDRTIVAVEKDFSVLLDAHTGLRFRGKIDRIEKWDNTIRILDYKTGGVSPSDHQLKGNKPMAKNDIIKSNKLMQLIIYVLAAENMNFEKCQIEAGFISLRTITQGWKMLEVNWPDNTWRDAVIDQLNTYLEEMRRCVSWRHSDDAKYCSFCSSLGYNSSKEIEMDISVSEVPTKE